MRYLVKMNMGVCIMTWEQAKQEIKKHIVVNVNVNTLPGMNKNGRVSKYRIVKSVCGGVFTIPRGKKSTMKVTWDMLEKFWNGMVDNGGVYDPKAVVLPASCYVQTIHMIFKKAGLT